MSRGLQRHLVVVGQHDCYAVTEGLQAKVVYKGERVNKVLRKKLGLPRRIPDESSNPFVMIKLRDGMGGQFDTELGMYGRPFVRQCPWIRAHIETVRMSQLGQDAMVYEWMDTTLSRIEPETYRSGSELLPRLVARGVLKALEVLHDNGYIHGDTHMHNIFLSRVDTPNPIVKLGDLGLVLRVGKEVATHYRPQGTMYRAPESWKGSQPSPKLDIWSLGVSLSTWLVGGEPIFGPRNVPPDVRYSGAWCVSKIIRLRGDIELPINVSPFYGEISMGTAIESGGYTSPRSMRQINVQMETRTLREELESTDPPIEPECIDFLEYLLTVDPDQRPSAREALEHPWLQSLPSTPDGTVHSGETTPVGHQGTEQGDSRKEDTQTDNENQNQPPDQSHASQPGHEEEEHSEGARGRKLDFPHCRCN